MPEAAAFPWHRGLARLPGARWSSADGLVAVDARSTYAGFNAVLQVDGLAAERRAAAKLSTGPWIRWSPGPDPDALDERLLAAGFHQRRMDVMTGELAALELSCATQDVVWIREPRDIAACVDLAATVFAVAAAQRGEFLRVHMALSTGERPAWRMYALRMWGTVVATCVLASRGETVEIAAAATSPVARGRRWGAAVVATALRTARDEGRRRVVACTEPGGTVLARRLGLEHRGVVRHLGRPAG